MTDTPHHAGARRPDSSGSPAPVTAYFRLMARRGASDLFFSPGAPVHIKVGGVTCALGGRPLPPGTVARLADPLLNDAQRRRFARTLELNTGLAVPGAGRFRINLYRSRGETAMVVRHIRDRIPTPVDLRLPPVLKELVMAPRGLVLVAGATGAGKSTTLASLIDCRNARKTGHILTIEEPIEYLHRHRRSVVDQREVGVDTLSYAAALKNAMREAPDVILIGEVRDRRTLQHAIAYAETGHLCLTTLHARNAVQALERAVNLFPPEAHRQVRQSLALNLNAVVSQRLLRGLDGRLRPAVEVMINTPYIATLIDRGDVHKIRGAMAQGAREGMRTFEGALFEMYAAGAVSLEEALSSADSRTDLQLRMKLSLGSSGDGFDTACDATDRRPDPLLQSPVPSPGAGNEGPR